MFPLNRFVRKYWCIHHSHPKMGAATNIVQILEKI